MKFYDNAKTLGDLIRTLEKLADEVGSDATWHGHDDGSIMLFSDHGNYYVTVEPEVKPPVVEYQCSYCGHTAKSTRGPKSCNVCSWRPMMKPTGEKDATDSDQDQQQADGEGFTPDPDIQAG